MQSDCLLSVVVVINDGSLLKSFFGELVRTLRDCVNNYEIIVVANGLHDEDIDSVKSESLSHMHTRMLMLSENNPTDIAYAAGIDNSIGDYVIMMDIRTDPVSVIPRMLDSSEEGVDIIIASSGAKRYTSLLSRLLGFIYFKLAQLMLPQASDIDPSYFTCFSRKALNALSRNKGVVRSYRFLRSQLGLSRKTLYYEPIKRSGNTRKANSTLLMWLGIESFLSYSLVPLRLFSAISFVLGGLSYLFLVYVLFSWLFNPNVVSGWTSSTAIFGLMFGSLFILMGIFGIYFSILLREVKKVPLYHITDEFDSGSAITNMQKKNVV